MVRPKVDNLLRKDTKTTFRTTETESEALKWYADRFGLSVSDFIRQVLKPALESAIECAGSSDAHVETTKGGKAS